ncbi:hypothetical protein BJF91_01595 [Allorhizobium taibaishanense]|uniref:Uncharacterized protein n=1 Tax=Allorhizobium taibaishanense TaxID=887144 RepID=A0A1Q9A2C7_9HYPH|nr:hypothetical protein BJF91_01595 [Allorhizobium taibaishanense]
MGVPFSLVITPSDTAHQQQNNDNYNDQAKTARRTVTPITAMAPGRKRSQEQQYQDDNKNSAEHGGFLSLLQ